MSSAVISRDQLRSIVERIERLEEEKQAIADDIKEVYAEAKGNGFDTPTIRKVVKLRKQDTAERQEQEALLDVYLAALGMTPIEREIASADAAGAAESTPSGIPREASGTLKRRVGKSIKAAVATLGTPAELTDEERAQGMTAAFIGKDGTRLSIGASVRV